MTDTDIERMAREAEVWAVTGEYIPQSREFNQRLARFAAIVQDDAARFIEAHSRETYGVALREHNEAAEWLRALKDRP